MTRSATAAEARRPRLILLTQWFDPEPTFKGEIFAQALHARGFDVEVVTGFPNYPGGKLYPGYRIRPIQRETIGPVQVTRLPLYPSHDQSAVGRAANYISFFLSSCLYLLFGARKADAIYTYHPPITVGCAAAIARLFRRTPTIIDVQDMWPDTLKATGMIGNPRLLGLIEHVCLWLYQQVDHIVVLSPGFRNLLKDRGVPDGKVSVIYNWADEQAVAGAGLPVPAALAAPNRFRVMFAGNMGRAQALANVLDSAELVARRAPHVDICMMGGGLEVANLQKKASAGGLSNVHFLPQVPMREVGAFLNAADCLLVHLRDDPLFAITIPSKTQAYLAAGKPVIMAVLGDAADLIREAGCGNVVPPEDAVALADAIVDMALLPREQIAALGRAAKRYYDDNLSLEKGVDTFATLFRNKMEMMENR
jgi:colanic acid biosynthesis glycosyl transferase WcaI